MHVLCFLSSFFSFDVVFCKKCTDLLIVFLPCTGFRASSQSPNVNLRFSVEYVCRESAAETNITKVDNYV